MIDLYWADSLYGQVEPQQRFEWTIRSLTALIQAESLCQPVVIQVEDGHWVDSDSLAVIASLIRTSSSYPIALVITCRYQDDGTPWRLDLKGHVRQTVCELGELSQENVQALAAQTLAGNVAEPLAAFLHNKTGGNPFFVEQLVLDLRERGLLRHEAATGWFLAQEEGIEVPNSVSTILIARLDRLTVPVRSIVQTASVLGQEFERRVLLHMLSDDTEAVGLMTQVEAAAVWLPSREGHYLFRHQLLRDAAYDMQTSARKRVLHLRAATALISVYASDAPSQAVELAYHYQEAEYMSEAAQWYATAGDNARRIYALENEIEYYQKALASWRAASMGEESYREGRLHVLRSLGDALRLRSRAQEALDVYQAAYQDAVILGDAVRESDVSMRLAAVYYDEGNFRAALEHATRAEELMRSHPVSQTLRLSLELKSLSLFRLGQLDAAREAGERAVAVGAELGEDDQLAQSLSLLGLVLMTAGQNQRAVQHFERAVQIARDPLVVLGVTNNLGVAASALGDYERAAMHYEAALALARQHNIMEAEIVFRSNLGGAYVGRRFFDQAETELRQVLAVTQGSSFGDLSETYRFLAEALLGQDRPEEALVAAQRALALGREVGSPEFVATAWRVLGEVASRLSRSVLTPGEAVNESREYSAPECFRESARLCDEVGLKGERPRTLRAWALHELASGNRETGIQLWQQALDAFAAAGAIREVQRMNEMQP
jgi:tetratricopeptide (TPR) repeat protein